MILLVVDDVLVDNEVSDVTSPISQSFEGGHKVRIECMCSHG